MSDNKRYAIGLALSLVAGGAWAEDVPQHSILNRYGVTPDQLPAAVPGAVIDEAEPAASLFHIEPEQPWITASPSPRQQPEVTGNISIDNATAQEFERCQRARGELQKRGQQSLISCDSSVPGMSRTPWSP